MIRVTVRVDFFSFRLTVIDWLWSFLWFWALTRTRFFVCECKSYPLFFAPPQSSFWSRPRGFALLLLDDFHWLFVVLSLRSPSSFLTFFLLCRSWNRKSNFLLLSCSSSSTDSFLSLLLDGSSWLDLGCYHVEIFHCSLGFTLGAEHLLRK